MAQPPLSQSLQRLERHLGVQLLERDSRRVSLTPAGRVVLAESQDLLNHADQFLSNIAEAPGGAIQLAEIGDATLRTSLQGGHLDIAVLAAASDDPGLVSGPSVAEHLGV